MVGGEQKMQLLRDSSGLIFPVRWHEPFGLAIIESMYFGAPVFATPYGALPELVTPENGVLSNDKKEMARAVTNFVPNRKLNHDRARQLFNAQRMASDYLIKYLEVIDGYTLNPCNPIMIESAVALDWV